MHLMRQKQKGRAMSLWVILPPSQGTGSFGISYRFSISVIEWGDPGHGLITFSTLRLKRNQQIDLYIASSWEALRTDRGSEAPGLGSLTCVWLSVRLLISRQQDLPSSCPACLSNRTTKKKTKKNPPIALDDDGRGMFEGGEGSGLRLKGGYYLCLTSELL